MPRPENVEKALEQIRKSAANYRYFFEKLTSPSWLAPLAAKGRFSAPPAMIEVEGGVMFPPWPEAQYLARMAKVPEAQAQVLQIVLGMPTTDNIAIHSDLMDVALALPPAQSARLVDRACTWVQSRFEGLVNYKVGDLVAHLADGGQAQAALRLASAALAIEPAVPMEDEREFAPSPEPRAYLKDWHYEEALKKVVPALVSADSDAAFALLCGLLDRAVSLSRRAGDRGEQDYSYIWHDAIEQDENPPRLRNSLISAVRNAAETMIQGDAGTLARVLAELRRHPWPVFKRIELHLLNRFAEVAIEEITPLAVQLAAMDPATTHEAARLLKTAFGQLPQATQEAVLQWIAAGPGHDYLQRVREFIGQQADADAMERYANQWRAQRFALFADQVPAAWKERVDAVLTAAGETRKLDELEDRGGWARPARRPQQTLKAWDLPTSSCSCAPGRHRAGTLSRRPRDSVASSVRSWRTTQLAMLSTRWSSQRSIRRSSASSSAVLRPR
jgi:hypothetical protein